MNPDAWINKAAKDALEAINELLVEGYAGRAAVELGEFLDTVTVYVPFEA